MPRNPGEAVESWLRDRVAREERHRRMDLDLDWRTWARRRLAPYWYGLLATLLDVALVATVLGALRGSGAGPYGIASMALILAVYAEMELYRRLFPGHEATGTGERSAIKARKTRRPAADRPALEVAGGASPPPESPRPDEVEGATPETHE